MDRQRVVSAASFLCAAMLTLSCGKRDASRSADSAADTTGTVAASAAGASDWVPELGQLLVVPSDSDNAAVVLFPSAPSPRLVASAPLTLLNAGGDSVRARLAMTPADSQQCGDAPIVRLTGTVPATWSVGLLGRTAATLRMDSIEALPQADSARLAADLARLASALPAETESRFTGLPFVVLDGRRFTSDSVEIVVAHLVRRLPQEATPLEEHTLIIAERPAASAKTVPYTVTHYKRSAGSEETSEHFEVLAAVRGRESTLLLLARDQEARTLYEVLERKKPGGWTTRWSRMLSC